MIGVTLPSLSIFTFGPKALSRGGNGLIVPPFFLVSPITFGNGSLSRVLTGEPLSRMIVGASMISSSVALVSGSSTLKPGLGLTLFEVADALSVPALALSLAVFEASLHAASNTITDMADCQRITVSRAA
jgi:hypothetical protein